MTQEQVAERLGCSQRTVARLERRALRKLSADPEVRTLLRYICEESSKDFTPAVEPNILRKLGSPSADTSFLTLHGFAPNL